MRVEVRLGALLDVINGIERLYHRYYKRLREAGKVVAIELVDGRHALGQGHINPVRLTRVHTPSKLEKGGVEEPRVRGQDTGKDRWPEGVEDMGVPLRLA